MRYRYAAYRGYAENAEIPQDCKELEATWLDLDGLSALSRDLATLTSLTSLKLHGYLHRVDEVRLALFTNTLSHLLLLTSLDMSANGLGELDEARLALFTNAIAQLTSLTSLRLRGNKLDAWDEAQLTLFTNAMSRLTMLTTLDLSSNKLAMLDEARLALFTNTLLYLPSLTSLDLSHNDLGKQDEARLALFTNAIARLTSLTSLGLSGNKLNAWDEAQLTLFTNALSRLTVLASLNLGDNQLYKLDEARLALFTNTLSNLPSLTSLDLCANGLDRLNAVGLTLLANALTRLNSLTFLNLSCNRLGNLDVTRLTLLTNALTRLTSLTFLDLRTSWLFKVDEAQLTLFTDTLAQLPSLTSLRLSENDLGKLDNARFTLLTSALARLTSLTYLDLFNNNFGNLNEASFARLTNTLVTLTSLTSLDLSCNELGKLDKARFTLFTNAIARLTSLTSLELQDEGFDQITYVQFDMIIKRNKQIQQEIQNIQTEIEALSASDAPIEQASVDKIMKKIDALQDLTTKIEEQYGGKPFALIDQCNNLLFQLALIAGDLKTASNTEISVCTLPRLPVQKLQHNASSNTSPDFIVFPKLLRAFAKHTDNTKKMMELLDLIRSVSLDHVAASDQVHNLLLSLAVIIDPTGFNPDIHSALRAYKILDILEENPHSPEKVEYVQQTKLPLTTQLNNLADHVERFYFSQAIEQSIISVKISAEKNRLFSTLSETISLHKLKNLFHDQNLSLSHCTQELNDFLNQPKKEEPFSLQQTAIIDSLTELLGLAPSQDKMQLRDQLFLELKNRFPHQPVSMIPSLLDISGKR